MRSLAKQVITTAAKTAGIDRDNVIDKPKRQSKALLPKPRLEFETLGEDVTRDGKVIAKLDGTNPETHTKYRKRLYKTKLKVRAVIKAETEEEAETLYKKFLLAIPRRTQDNDNNLVVVSVDKLERGGYETKLVEVMAQREIVLSITFEGGIYQDYEIPLIREVDVRSNLTVNP